ncbi:MAG: hypothetical protein GX640_23380 [Fibrobacter sp.]|nr:hypothetical protein [Fibrobacter sp.]
MRYLTVALLIIFMTNSIIFSQDMQYFKGEYEKAKKKETTGMIMTSATLAIATLGTVLMVANRDHTYSYSNANGAGFGFTSVGGGVGLLITLPAPPLLIAGVVKWARGAKNKKYYKRLITY